MRTNLFVFALLTGGCFSDLGEERGSGEDGSDDMDVTNSCTDDCDDTGDEDEDDTGGVDTGDDDTGDDESNDTSDEDDGTSTNDTDMSDSTGSVACASNSDCPELEVCSAGLEKCIPADEAVYEVQVSYVEIRNVSGSCYGDPDESTPMGCDMEFYVKASVGEVVVHIGLPLYPHLQNFNNYGFLVELSTTEQFTFEIWDSDIDEHDLQDDLLLTRTIDTSAEILHQHYVEEIWDQDISFKKSMVLVFDAQ